MMANKARFNRAAQKGTQAVEKFLAKVGAEANKAESQIHMWLTQKRGK